MLLDNTTERVRVDVTETFIISMKTALICDITFMALFRDLDQMCFNF